MTTTHQAPHSFREGEGEGVGTPLRHADRHLRELVLGEPPHVGCLEGVGLEVTAGGENLRILVPRHEQFYPHT